MAWEWGTRSSLGSDRTLTPEIDWSKITKPAMPQIDWSAITPPKPTASIPIPEIDWSKITPPKPVKPITSLNLSHNIPDEELPTSLDVEGAEDYSPQLGVPDIQLQPSQYLKVDLGQGSQMPRSLYDEANARKTDINLPANASPREVPTIQGYASNLMSKLRGSPEVPPNLPEVMKSEFGKPIAEGVPKALNLAGIGPSWTAINEPLLPEAEAFPGEVVEDIPGVGPKAKQIADFLASGTTSIGGMATLGGGAALRTALKSGGYLSRKYNQAQKAINPVKQIIGPLTKDEALAPSTLGYRLIKHIEDAKVTRQEQKAMYKAELRARVKARAGVTSTGFQGLQERSATLKGPLPKQLFKPLTEEQFNQTERAALIDIIEGSKDLQQLDKQKAQSGLAKMMGQNVAGVPQKSELELLEKAFPGISQIRKQAPKTGFLHGVGEFGGAARALEASMDLSFPGRQGIWLASRPQYWQSWKPMKEALTDTGYAAHIDELPKKYKHFGLGQRAKLDVTDARDIFNSEEEFSSILAKVPGIRHSSYGYSAFANTLRHGMFDDMVEAAIVAGKNPYKDKKLAKEIAEYVNSATGRGSWGSGKFGKIMTKNAHIVNQTLFSPKLIASRLDLLKRALIEPAKTGINVARGGVDLTRVRNLPGYTKSKAIKSFGEKLAVKAEGLNTPGFSFGKYQVPGIQKGQVPGIGNIQLPEIGKKGKLKGKPTGAMTTIEKDREWQQLAQVDPFIRRQFWRDFLGYMGTQAAIMAPFKAAQMMGAPVEFSMDPTNPNFGKAKMGNVRFDSNGGFQPYIRTAAQILAQRKASSVTGKSTALNEGYRGETDVDVAAKLLMGKTSPLVNFMLDIGRGRTITGQPISLVSEMQSKLTPIFAQDFVAVMKENPKLAPLLIPTFFGTSMQIYGPGDIKKQEGGSDEYNLDFDFDFGESDFNF